MTFIRNRWYVAAWDSEVDRTPIARTICGEAVMLYRKLDRGVVAMRDACPHRLLPLSMGIKEGDSIRCRYPRPEDRPGRLRRGNAGQVGTREQVGLCDTLPRRRASPLCLGSGSAKQPWPIPR